jgi:hypothetical protein
VGFTRCLAYGTLATGSDFPVEVVSLSATTVPSGPINGSYPQRLPYFRPGPKGYRSVRLLGSTTSESREDIYTT